LDVELWDAVGERVGAGDLAGAAGMLEGLLAAEPGQRFKGLLGRPFGNPPAEVLSSINAFIAACAARFDLRAVYLEMNGFDINYDRWYFDCFGYAQYGADPEDLEWLCDWQSGEWPDVHLTGLEAVQADFQWYDETEACKDSANERTCEIATLLVMVRFTELVQAALRAGPLARSVPVLATAHDFDIVARYAA
jgi:hypothetical protein